MDLRRFLLKSLGAYGLCLGISCSRIDAIEPNCGLKRESSCATVPDCEIGKVEKRLVFVPVPLCHGLKCLPRPWFLSTEPPRADVLEAVAIRRDQAPLRDRDLSFEIVQDRGLDSDRNRDVESTCQNSRRIGTDSARSRDALSESDCRKSGTQLQQFRDGLEDVNGRVDGLRSDINKLADAVRELAQLQRAHAEAGDEQRGRKE